MLQRNKKRMINWVTVWWISLWLVHWKIALCERLAVMHLRKKCRCNTQKQNGNLQNDRESLRTDFLSLNLSLSALGSWLRANVRLR